MKNDNEFQDIGKDLPYHVPEDFFNQIAEKTLLNAKKREEQRKKKVFKWTAISIAASLAVLIVTGYYLTAINSRPKTTPLAEQNPPVDQPVLLTTPSEPVLAELPESNASDVRKDLKKGSEDKTADEEFADVLTSLSDEDLILLATAFEADIFIDETTE